METSISVGYKYSLLWPVSTLRLSIRRPVYECFHRVSLNSLELYYILHVFLKRKMSRPLPLNPWDEKNCRLNAVLVAEAARKSCERGSFCMATDAERHADFHVEVSRSHRMLNLITPGLLAGDYELILRFESIGNFKSKLH